MVGKGKVKVSKKIYNSMLSEMGNNADFKAV